jgi:hydroxypyruvate reductase
VAPNFQDHPSHFNQIIEAALAAVDPAASVRRYLSLEGDILLIDSFSKDISQGRLFLIGFGKAALSMGSAAVTVLGRRLSKGILIAKGDDGEGRHIEFDLPANIRVFYASHPVSDERGLSATNEVKELVEQAEANDFVLCLISGGASSLLTLPRIPLSDWKNLIDLLLASGCTINELNAVRKQLDEVKGGGLARMISPATFASLILSDVVGNPLDIIGSGPTAPNPDKPANARQVLHRYNIKSQLNPEVWQRIEDQLEAIESEEERQLSQVFNTIVGDIQQAAQAAAGAARKLGFQTQLLTSHLEGEAREVGRVVAALAKDAPARSCLILGGETTVTLHGDGLGGRNQELALATAIALEGWPGIALASFATDGDDGPTGAAGAIVTGTTVKEASIHHLDPIDYLNRNDSYHFFQQVGGLIVTGQTGTNVNDLILILKYEEGLKDKNPHH